ncbi:MAG: hypothetical protein JWL76_1500 [Thermoleophilia bacterium]|nr:hypothetical protein [Thermoleophilia bacterium]
MQTTDSSKRVVPVGANTPTSTVNWGAIILAVVIGMGITMLLVAVGAAAGAMAEDGDVSDGDSGKIAAAVGAWTVIAALGGTFVGSYIGGRFNRWSSRGSAVYHAMGAWGVSIIVGAWLGASGTSGLLGSSLTASANQPRKAQAAASGVDPKDIVDAIGWSGWALAGGLALTLIVAVTAWWSGAHRSLDDFEVEAA